MKNFPHLCKLCGATLLEQIGTEYYCRDCQTPAEDLLIQDMQVMPILYQTNHKAKTEIEYQRRIKNSIHEFSDKYIGTGQPYLVLQLRKKLEMMKKAAPHAKGTRQAAALVVYMSAKDEIRLSMKEYCKRNNLSIKVLNQKYKVYHKLFLTPTVAASTREENSSEPAESPVNIKVEEKLDQSRPAQKSQNMQLKGQALSDNINNFDLQKTNTAENCRKVVGTIFDSVFRGYYFKQKRKLVMSKLAERIEQIDSSIFKDLIEVENSHLELFYTIFAVIKTLGHKIGFQRYKDIVKNKAGYILKRHIAVQIKKNYFEYLKSRAEEEHNEAPKEIASIKKEEYINLQDLFIPINSILVEQQYSPFIIQEEYSPFVVRGDYFPFDDYYCQFSEGSYFN